MNSKLNEQLSEPGDVQHKQQNSLKSQIAPLPNQLTNSSLVSESSPSISSKNEQKNASQSTTKAPNQVSSSSKEPGNCSKDASNCPSVGSSLNSTFSALSTSNSQQDGKHSKENTGDRLTNGHADAAEERCDLFPGLVFDLKELFRLSVSFTRENENKAFYPSYDDRNYLYALNYQIKLGPFNEEKAPQLGALDFVGKDRRLAWKALADLSRTAAMKQFICELNRICPSFKPFVEAHNQEKVERERLLREEQERKRIEEETRLKEEEEERSRKAESDRKEKQR